MLNKVFVIVSFILFLMLISCGGKKENTELKKNVLAEAKKVFAVLPDKMPGSDQDTPELIFLGEKLFLKRPFLKTARSRATPATILQKKTPASTIWQYLPDQEARMARETHQRY